ncbi:MULTISPECIES: 7-cyano-7-deazaguanine synthase [unclassified Acidovorax]|uniref:7-cyano-7-deazaguanine synthase n=1 Tax=unclassified Acidovorax TaxID=2684926 RepID=UPI001C483BC9|nr:MULTISPECIES: 7-cyano-7-deazaguanine synthase [unclassified Acidovorax]MBV7427326.1 7-cyano-7-deazaguanine synthase [Acidovorax sp. sif0732]MBV7448450.1 7-cyano-7-deazaguanine synthase [Acidovorax sp. sif0715]
MSIVNLVSGGLDSTVIAVMINESGVEQFPLFIDYGQRAAQREWDTCLRVHDALGLPKPEKMDLSGFGRVIESGLTRKDLPVKEAAFTPGRNFMFLLMASSYAYQVGASSIAIGLLSEQFSIFPDQRQGFLELAERAIGAAMGREIAVLTPLMDAGKADVVQLAKVRGIVGTYSCHVGDAEPCGECIACSEFNFEREA